MDSVTVVNAAISSSAKDCEGCTVEATQTGGSRPADGVRNVTRSANQPTPSHSRPAGAPQLSLSASQPELRTLTMASPAEALATIDAFHHEFTSVASATGARADQPRRLTIR